MSPHLPEVRNLKELLEPVLEPGNKVIGFSSKSLTAPGDNYGSTMLALTVDIVSETDEPKQIHVVAKMRPTSEEFLDIFQIHITFAMEAALYTEIVPVLVGLQRELGCPENRTIDVFSRCYNARVSLDPESSKVDADGVILFENLKTAGFVTGNRRKGFPRDTADFVLKKLSLFHALPVVLRYRKPDVFENRVNKYLVQIDIDAGLGGETIAQMIEVLRVDLGKAGIEEPQAGRIMELVKSCRHRQANLVADELNEYTSMLHNDLWVNNMMIKYDSKNRPSELKFVDFQLIQLNSLVRDVLFFIFTSVTESDFEEHVDTYLRNYFDYFRQQLAELQCPCLEKYTFVGFLEEVNRIAPREFYHIVSMLRVVLARKESIPEQSDLDAQVFCNDNLVEKDYFDRLAMVVQIYDRKGWIGA
ncbi:uncharacterized protein LOC129749831 isoform X2 [Uranotaenia lowii]|uniref:uncharacterized protein LOC129749831 isoform X2 n=1 Tax=Uranotaenia lowii TaxID=190385 RepID=UPI00247AC952|nr:uncharacterized protein LOC129749831 isoform X2 [Uranotaenia lowii]